MIWLSLMCKHFTVKLPVYSFANKSPVTQIYSCSLTEDVTVTCNKVMMMYKIPAFRDQEAHKLTKLLPECLQQYIYTVFRSWSGRQLSKMCIHSSLISSYSWHHKVFNVQCSLYIICKKMSTLITITHYFIPIFVVIIKIIFDYFQL